MQSKSGRDQGKKGEEQKIVWLGDKFPDIKFTCREAECMQLLLKDKTINKVAEDLDISVYTVEYYLSKMRYKLRCQSKTELINKILESDFLTNAKRVGIG